MKDVQLLTPGWAVKQQKIEQLAQRPTVYYMRTVMTSDETKVQMFVDRSTSHAKQVSVNNKQNLEYHVVVVIIE